MKQPVRRKNCPDLISQSLNHRLGLYALAASAAGAGILTVPQALEASVVYTPANIRLSSNGKLGIDLNHDGIADFYLSIKVSGSCCSFYTRSLNVIGGFVGSFENGVVGVGLNANALTPGQAIGPKQLFLQAPLRMAAAFNDSNSFFDIFGAFANKTDRFVGLRFQVNGEIHYGWARFSKVTAGFNGSYPVVVATLTGYAYETDANEAITAGQTSGSIKASLNSVEAPYGPHPATLGVLALGTAGLSLWRRENEMALAI
jgi:hypothetical protein